MEEALPLDEALPSRRPSGRSTVPAAPTTSKLKHKLKPTAPREHFHLIKRVLSVAEFRQERQLRSRISPPPPPPKGIPVPLYPGETMQNYTHKFKQWLSSKNIRLEAMRGNPKGERKLWLSFAFLRVSTDKSETPRGRKRGLDEEYEAFYQRSASQEMKRLRQDNFTESDKRSESRGRQDCRTHDSTSDEFNDEEVAHKGCSYSNLQPRVGDEEILSSHQMPPRTTTPRSSSPTPHPSRGEKDRVHSRKRPYVLDECVLSAEEYLRDIGKPKQDRRTSRPHGKISMIPVPLFPGETREGFEQEFDRWLHEQHTSVFSLRAKPLKERVYRHQFAHQRVFLKKNTLLGPRAHARSMSSTSSPDFTPRHHVKHDSPSALNGESENLSPGFGKMVEALSPTCSLPSSSPVATSTVDREDTEETYLHSSHLPSCELAQIDTGKHSGNPDNTIKCMNSDVNADEQAERENQNDHCGTSADTSSTQESSAPTSNQTDMEYPSLESAEAMHNEDPPASALDLPPPALAPEEAPFHSSDQQTANLTPTTTTPAQPSEDTTTPKQSKPCNLSTSDQESDIYTSHTEEKLPSWASQLINRVQELEAEVTELKNEVALCRASTCCHPRTGKACSGESDLNDVVVVDGAPSQAFSAKATPTLTQDDRVICPRHGNTDSKLSRDPGEEMTDTSAGDPQQLAPFSQVNNAITRKYVVRDILPNAEDIYTEASRNLARAIQARVKEDPKKRQLTEAYDHLNQQIEMNETAIDDALTYVKAIKDVDEAVATEQHGQIMELVVSINKEKERRACALAELIRYNWTGSKDALLTLLEEEISEEHQTGATHERLSTISSQIEQQDSVLETLEMHLNEQLQWVTGISVDVPEADKALRFKALRKLSKRLTKEQATKEKLEREREEVMICFLQGNEDIRKLLMDSLRESRLGED